MDEGQNVDGLSLGLLDLSNDTLCSVLVVLASSSRAQIRNAALACKRLATLSSRPEVIFAWLQKTYSRLTSKFLREFFKHISSDDHLSLTKLLITDACNGDNLAGFDWETYTLISVELGFILSACLLYTTPAEPIAEPSSESTLGPAPQSNVVRSSSGRSAAASMAASITRVSASRRPLLNSASNPIATTSYRGGGVNLAMPSMRLMRNSRDQGGAGPSTRIALDRPSLSSSLLFVALENDALAHVPKLHDPTKINEEEEEVSEEMAGGVRPLTLAHVDFLDNAAIKAACNRGCLESVIALCDLGANLQAPDGLPLALAAGGGHVSLVRWLVECHGADVNMGNARALHAAIASEDKNQLEVLSILLSNGVDVHRDNDFALRWACSRGRISVAQVLISNGADVNAGKNDALYQAAKNGHLRVVELLIRQGANPREAKDAIKRAADRGHLQVATLLKREASRGKLQRMLKKKISTFLCFAP